MRCKSQPLWFLDNPHFFLTGPNQFPLSRNAGIWRTPAFSFLVTRSVKYKKGTNQQLMPPCWLVPTWATSTRRIGSIWPTIQPCWKKVTNLKHGTAQVPAPTVPSRDTRSTSREAIPRRIKLAYASITALRLWGEWRGDHSRKRPTRTSNKGLGLGTPPWWIH